MQAVILAGGKGTRLKPYTANFPKPLVPLGDRPILEIIIRQLAAQKFSRIVLSTGHLAELIQAYFGDGSRFGITIEYVRELTPLNTAGALQLLQSVDENFLVMNGDILTDLNYALFLEEHIRNQHLATIACKKRETRIDFGVLEKDPVSGKLSGYHEKPVYAHLVSMGIYALSHKAKDLIQPKEAIGMPDLLLRIKEKYDGVFCRETSCYWLDIGRVDDYEAAQKEFESRSEQLLTPGSLT